MAARYEENRAGLAKMLATPDMVEAMNIIGEAVRVRAEQIAPVDTGAYAFGSASPDAVDGGFDVDAGIENGAAIVTISNNVRSKPSRNWPDGYYYGVALEHGNSRIHGQRILGRALDAVNLA